MTSIDVEQAIDSNIRKIARVATVIDWLESTPDFQSGKYIIVEDALVAPLLSIADALDKVESDVKKKRDGFITAFNACIDAGIIENRRGG